MLWAGPAQTGPVSGGKPIRWVRSALAALAALSATVGVASAMRVTPMVYTLEPSGPRSSQTVTVDNTTGRPLAIETSVVRRTIAEDGTETREPADDDFLVFPPQAVIEPNQSQALRVRYIGDPQLTSSVSYIVFVKQVPVSFEKDFQGAGVSFAFNFGTAADVIPVGAAPDLQLESAERLPDGRWRLRIVNNGPAVTRVSDWRWRLQLASGREIPLEDEALREQLAGPMVMPNGGARVFTLKLPEEVGQERITGVAFRPL